MRLTHATVPRTRGGQLKDLLDALGDKIAVDDGCWNWTGAIQPTSRGGYGSLRRDGRTVHAHRVVWELFFGPVPVGLELDHLCRNRKCVRPSHLEAVTHLVNIRRGMRWSH